MPNTISGVSQSTQSFFKRIAHEFSPKQLSTLPTRAKEGIQRQKKEDPLILWVGMGGLPAALLTPFTVNWDLKHRPEITQKERHLLTTQEVIRQTVSAFSFWVGYYGGILITAIGLKEATKHKSTKQFMVGTLLGTLGLGIVRPIVTNTFLASHTRNEQQSNPFQNSRTNIPDLQLDTTQSSIK